MKPSDLVSIFAGGILAFIAWRTLAPATAGTGTATSGSLWPKLINVGNTAGTAAAGWQYFTDGTAIAPNGDYYYQGSLVYKANP